MSYGFTTLRDMGCADPEFPTVDLRNALAAGFVGGPRLIIAAHIISASAGRGDLRGFYASRWDILVSATADDAAAIKAHWTKTTNTGGYFSPGDDPARVTWLSPTAPIAACFHSVTAFSNSRRWSRAGLTPARALKAATSVAAELLHQDDIGILAASKQADIVAMPGDPLADIGVTDKVDFVKKRGTVYRYPALGTN